MSEPHSKVDYTHPRRTPPSAAARTDAAAPPGDGAAPGKVDYTHPDRAGRPGRRPPSAGAVPRTPDGRIDYTRRGPRRARAAEPAPAAAPRPGIDYTHPTRPLPRGATPAATGPDVGSAAVSGPGFLLHTNADGTVVRFDPDLPISVRVNTDQAGRWALDDVAEALWHVAQASGLTFRFAGETDRIPQLSDYGDPRLADPGDPSLTIAWAKPGRVSGGSDFLEPSELTESVPADLPPGAAAMAVGIGGWQTMAVRYGTGPWRTTITTAIVVIDSTVRELFPPGFITGPCRGAVLLHEIAHAVGLGHVDDPAQIMYPVVTDKPAVFGPGDLVGLQRVGAAAGPIF